MKTARAFTLIEMNLLVIIVGFFALGLMSLSTLTSKALVEVRVKNKANSLAVAMMEEIECRKWDELVYPLKSTTMGVDTPEAAANKLTFDDIDDFNGYSEPSAAAACPGATGAGVGPKDRQGIAIAGSGAFSVTVDTVCYVNSTLQISAVPTARKKITVTVKKCGVTRITLNTIVSQKNGL